MLRVACCKMAGLLREAGRSRVLDDHLGVAVDSPDSGQEPGTNELPLMQSFAAAGRA